MSWLLLACTASQPASDSAPTSTPPDAVAADPLPGDSAPPPEPELTTPIQVELTCPAAIPYDTSVLCQVVLTSPDFPDVVSADAALSGRGRSSADFPKPQYKLEFVDASGAPTPVKLFGMGSDDDWVLNGMWIDRAMVRNKLAWDVYNALATGPDHAPASGYAELTLNGAYQGIYLLNQTISRDGSRLDFASDTTGARFIVSADEAGVPSAVQYAGWALDYPTAPDGAATRAVYGTLAGWEAAIATGADPFESMDLDSFVLFVLTEEWMKNNDAYFLSHRVWRGDDGRLRMVPWDLDLTLGQPDYNDNSRSDLWVAYRPLLVTGSANAAFHGAFSARWRAARAGPLATEAVLARVEAQRTVMGDAIERNWTRWDITAVDFGGYLYPVTSSDEEFTKVEAWIVERLAWMDENVDAY